ncbi:hypothetical protein BDR03DRAFT_984677 [Suillus americanus]|nr:hypothetical protein BDR03DRAFT_984677 [Suillus americanus]
MSSTISSTSMHINAAWSARCTCLRTCFLQPMNKSSSLRGLVPLAFTSSNVSHQNNGQGSIIFVIDVAVVLTSSSSIVVFTHPYVPLAELMDVLTFVSYEMLSIIGKPYSLQTSICICVNLQLLCCCCNIVNNNTNSKQIGVALDQMLSNFGYVDSLSSLHSLEAPVAFVMHDVSKPAKAQRGTLSHSYAIVDLNAIPLDAWTPSCQSDAASRGNVIRDWS